LKPEDIEKIVSASLDGNFDVYRDNYDRLSFTELKQINEAWLSKYPDQHYFDSTFVVKSFERIISSLERSSIRVVELGGYDGALALEVLKLQYCRSDLQCKQLPSQEKIEVVQSRRNLTKFYGWMSVSTR